jgi:histidinol-phosphate aminotransferase
MLDRIHTVHRYPDGSGYYLKEKLGRTLALPAEQIVVGNGSNEIIELLVRTFLNPGDEVIQPFPTFLVYEKVVTGAGGILTSIPLKGLQVDLEAVVNAVTEKTKILFINNPNNPTGTVVHRRELERFLERVPDDVLVVLDEAYIEFVTDEQSARGREVLETHPLVVVLRTFSKLYGLAGLRIGYGFSSPLVADYLNRVRQPFNVNLLAQAAATAALDDEAFVARTLNLVKEGLAFLYAHLDRMGLEYVPTQTNFFLIRVPMGGKAVYERMLREGVIVRAMDSYGLEEYIRINVGLPDENERFIRTLEKVLNRPKSGDPS